ncbi:hypothetical protein ACMYSQ_010033 [Aspergillus niger]
MASITFKRRQHYAVFNSLELRQHEHLWKFHKAVRQTNARILTLRIFKLPRSTRKLRSVQQASSDMKKGVVAAQLVGSGESDIPCLMVPLVRTVELVRDPGSQPWITDGLIRTLSMEPTVDNRARQISISIDVRYFGHWIGPMLETQSLYRFGSFGSMPSMALSIKRRCKRHCRLLLNLATVLGTQGRTSSV